MQRLQHQPCSGCSGVTRCWPLLLPALPRRRLLLPPPLLLWRGCCLLLLLLLLLAAGLLLRGTCRPCCCCLPPLGGLARVDAPGSLHDARREEHQQHRE